MRLALLPLVLLWAPARAQGPGAPKVLLPEVGRAPAPRLPQVAPSGRRPAGRQAAPPGRERSLLDSTFDGTRARRPGRVDAGARAPLAAPPSAEPVVRMTLAPGFPVLTRRFWRAPAPRRPRPPHVPVRITVHHTMSPESRGEAETAAMVRNVHTSHVLGRGWSDIGYHYLIDSDGRVVEGVPVDRVGIHSKKHNAGNVGIALIGDFDKRPPTPRQVQGLRLLLGRLSGRYGLDLSKPGVLEGHRHQDQTPCPGEHVAHLLPELRTVPPDPSASVERAVESAAAALRLAFRPFLSLFGV